MDSSPIQRHYASEARIERLAERIADDHGLRAREFDCNDERSDELATLVASQRLDPAASDFLRECLEEITNPAPIETEPAEGMTGSAALDTLRQLGWFDQDRYFLSLSLDHEQFDLLSAYITASGKSAEEAIASLVRKVGPAGVRVSPAMARKESEGI